MIHNLAYTLIFGKPLIMYGGILTFLSFAFTAIIGYSNFKGHPVLPFKWHPRLAVVSLTIATLHAILGLSIFFNF